MSRSSIRYTARPDTNADNGPEFASRALDQWAYGKGIRLQFIAPGKLSQNAYIEGFNGRLQDECLNENLFSQSCRCP